MSNSAETKLARLIAITGADTYLGAVRRIRRLRKNERRGKTLTHAALKRLDAYYDKMLGERDE